MPSFRPGVRRVRLDMISIACVILLLMASIIYVYLLVSLFNYLKVSTDESRLVLVLPLNTVYISCAGVIDPDYTGEPKVIMCSLNGSTEEFKKGDRIAQLVLERCEVPPVIEVESLEDTSRGSGGFGSTGL